MKWYEILITGLKSLKNCIESDTWEYLENDKPISDLHIEYNGIKVDIPLELAETNEYIQASIKELIDLVNDTYIEED